MKSKKFMPPKYRPVDLARLKKFSQINWINLTEKDITEFDENGQTLLHYVAHQGFWSDLPIPLRDKKYWQNSKDNNTVYMLAFTSKNLSWVNHNDLTEQEILKRNDFGESLVSIAILNNNFRRIPKSSITEKVLTSPFNGPISEDFEDMIIHRIAEHNQTKYLTKELLKEEVLSIRGQYGRSTYHILAEHKQINLLPKEALTKKALQIKDFYGNEVLGTIVKHQPEAIPKEFLTPEMFYKNKVGKTPLHFWAESKNWDHIPNHLLNKESINLNSPNSPLALIIEQYVQNIAYEKNENNKLEITKKLSRLLTLSNEDELKSLKVKLEASGLDWDTKDLEEENILTAKLIQKELTRRKLVKELSKHDQSIEI